MFENFSHQLRDNPEQLNYGIAVTDLDGDGQFEFLVAGFGSGNLALKWDGQCYRNIADETLADAERRAIGVAAGDLDGDGQEEVYILNTDTFAGYKRFGDRLLHRTPNGWQDLFALPQHQGILNLTAGRSIACVDRYGTGRYGFFVANYGGPMRLYEWVEGKGLADVAPEAGVDLVTGGRSVLSLPLVSDHMDLFAANENGPNYLFRNLGSGSFDEVAAEAGLADPDQHGRGVAVLDADGDGRLDLVCGNWEGPHRLFLQMGKNRFREAASRLMSMPSRVRTVLAADFDNDGREEIFFNNIGQPNRLFARRDQEWIAVETGEAWEPEGLGTGAAYGDFDNDGRLELVIAHGESGAQPLTLYKAAANDNAYLRVLPLTAQGAPARGAIVRLQSEGKQQVRVIDAGSGYLCQMEPVAHFGLGLSKSVEWVEVRWPGGAVLRVESPAIRQTLTVRHP